MPGRAAGLRAKPSAAAAVALPCARAQMPEANAMENPAAIATQLTPLEAASPCAKAGTANESTESTINNLLNLLIVFLLVLNTASGWLTPYLADALTLAGENSVASGQWPAKP